MVLDDGVKKIHVRKGECVFIRRDHRVTWYKKPHNGEQYCGIFLMFARNFLREMYQKLQFDKVKNTTHKIKPTWLSYRSSPEFEPIRFDDTYFNRDFKPFSEKRLWASQQHICGAYALVTGHREHHCPGF